MKDENIYMARIQLSHVDIDIENLGQRETLFALSPALSFRDFGSTLVFPVKVN